MISLHYTWQNKYRYILVITSYLSQHCSELKLALLLQYSRYLTFKRLRLKTRALVVQCCTLLLLIAGSKLSIMSSTTISKLKLILIHRTVITSVLTKLPWPGDSEWTFQSSSQAATCPPATTRGGGFTLSLFVAGREAGKLRMPFFIVFGLT